MQAHINDPDFNPFKHPDVEQETESTNPEDWGTTSDNRLKVWQKHRYQYDQWGNCIEKKSGPRQVQHFSWDAEHQISSARTEQQGQQEGQQQTWHYAYDPFGRRIAKWQEHTKTLAGKDRKPQPEHVTHFSWDGNRLLAEYKEQQRSRDTNAEPSIRHRLFIYEPESFVPLAQIDSTWAKDKEARDKPLSNPFLQQITQEAQNDPALWSGKVLPFQRKLQAKLKAQGIAPDKPKEASQSTTLYYHSDHLGTPRELTNQEGSVVWAATYKAWGNTETIEYPRIRQTTQNGNTLQERWVDQEAQDKPQQHLRFQGQYYDEETGLHYNRFRYYDPDCGRFVSQDPIGLYGGQNLYLYASNPVGWIDPLGLSCTRLGIKRTNASDWRKLRNLWDDLGYGDTLSPGNRTKIAKGKTPIVDDQWIKTFPGDASLKGERIPMHHIGGTPVTVPLPDSRHIDAHMPGGFRNNPGGPGGCG